MANQCEIAYPQELDAVGGDMMGGSMPNSRSWHGGLATQSGVDKCDSAASSSSFSRQHMHPGGASTVSAASSVTKQLRNVASTPLRVTFRTEKVFERVSLGLRSCANMAHVDIGLLKSTMEAIPLGEISAQGKLYDVEKQTRVTERYLKRIEYHLARIDELKEQYDMQLRLQHGAHNIASAFDSGGVSLSGGSLGRRKANDLKCGMRDVARAIGRIEGELEALMGALQIELKGVIGFARVTPGDVFEVTVKCGGGVKWKTRGKAGADRTTKWDKNGCVLKCRLDEAVDVRICEVKLFGKTKPLTQQQFDPCQFLSSEPQLLTMNLNANGSIKLQLIITWRPIDTSLMSSTDVGSMRYPPIAAAPSSPHTSSLSTDSRSSSAGTGRIMSAGQKSKQRPTSVFFSGTQANSGLFDTFQKNSTSDVSPLSGTLPRIKPHHVAAPKTNDVLMNLLKSVKPLLKRHVAQYTQLKALENAVTKVEFALKRNMFKSSDNLTGNLDQDDGDSSDDLDNNVLLSQHSSNNGTLLTEARSSDPYDSGFDSFRRRSKSNGEGHQQQPSTSSPIIDQQHRISPGSGIGGAGPLERRFKHLKQRRRQSIGVSLDDYLRDRGLSPTLSSVGSSGHAEIDKCLAHHLRRCQSNLQSLCYTDGPLRLKEQEIIQRLLSETRTFDYITRLMRSLPDLPNLSHVLSELEACAELQDVWLSASVPLRALFVVGSTDIRREIDNCFGPLIAVRYPELVSQVVDTLMWQICDQGEWRPSTTVSLFQFIGFFRNRHLTSFIESMAHEAWISRGLTSGDDDVVEVVMERLGRVPVAPPVESVRHIGLLLTDCRRQRQRLGEAYLMSCESELREDLIRIYFSLLEHNDELTRVGAIRALVVLNALESALAVAYVADRDRNDLVRREANQALVIFERIMMRKNRPKPQSMPKMTSHSQQTQTIRTPREVVSRQPPPKPSRTRVSPPPLYRGCTKV